MLLFVMVFTTAMENRLRHALKLKNKFLFLLFHSCSATVSPPPLLLPFPHPMNTQTYLQGLLELLGLTV